MRGGERKRGARSRRRLLALALGLVLSRCAAVPPVAGPVEAARPPSAPPPGASVPEEPPTVTLEVTRRQPPLVRLEGQPLSVGILLVHADDALLENLRSDLWNLSGLLVKATRDYFKAAGGQVQVVDYTDLGFQLWNRPRTKAQQQRDPKDLEMGPWPGAPLGVKTSLVTVVKVVRASAGPVDAGGGAAQAVSFVLLMSTWTREGQPVSTELLDMTGNTRGALRLQSLEAALALYDEVRGPSRRPLPEDPAEMLWAMLREGVGLHYFRWLPHEVPERLVLVGTEADENVRALREGRDADALEGWRRKYEEEPEAHGALYDAAMVLALRGEDSQALRLLAEARQVKDLPLYEGAWQRVHQRVSRRLVVGAPPARPERPGLPAPEAREAEQCFTIEREPTRDPRWFQGISLLIEEALLAEYHPAQCGRPGVRCSIDYYQVKWGQGLWSEPFLPGLNDLDPKPHYDGTRRRKWSYFYDHLHRYRYCAR